MAAPNTKALGVTSAEGLQETKPTNAASVPPAEALSKTIATLCQTIATLTARLALAGFAVHRLDGGGFLVSKWNLTKHCPDLRALAGFAQQVGARA